jgi:DNA polymerase III subunit alpha, Gram-positive type
MSKYYIFGDVETTGLSEKTERMTEIALVKTDEQFNITDKFQMLINPERTVSAKITELTGITEDMVKDEPKYEEAVPMIEEFWNNGSEITESNGEKICDEIIFVAHNAPFDIKFINKAFEDVNGKPIITDFIDTVSLARELYPFWRNHKLETCAKKFNVMNENHHRAMNDTMVLYQIGKRLIPEAIESNLDPVNFRTKKKLHYKKGNN